MQNSDFQTPEGNGLAGQKKPPGDTGCKEKSDRKGKEVLVEWKGPTEMREKGVFWKPRYLASHAPGFSSASSQPPLVALNVLPHLHSPGIKGVILRLPASRAVRCSGLFTCDDSREKTTLCALPGVSAQRRAQLSELTNTHADLTQNFLRTASFISCSLELSEMPGT